jgi:uncharacterized protein YdhG (YjbR/CyaY superfamily)
MVMPAFASVDDYIASQPEPARGVLTRMRNSIRRALPGADEVISYGIPAYKLHGRVVLYIAGWKEHYSFYPSTAALVAAFKTELAPYEVNDKGTIRFPRSKPVPLKLLAALAKFRAKEVAERQKARTARTATSKRSKTRQTV